MIEWRTTKRGKKTFSKIVNGHKISVYDINGGFSIRIDEQHVIYVSSDDVESKLKEYCEKLHYVDVEKFIEFEQNNNSKASRHYGLESKDKRIFMSIHIDGDAYLPMVKATDRITEKKVQRQIASRVYDYNEAISILQEKMNSYDELGYFTRDDMSIRKNSAFVEEKLTDEVTIETDCYVWIEGVKLQISQEQAETIEKMIENDII